MVSTDVAHAEQGAWKGLAPGWRQLYGDFGRLGLSIEWHDFRTQRALDWGRSFHPQSLEFCLNLDGRGAVRAQGTRSDYLPGNSGYYAVADEPLSASRQARDHHQFVTLEFSRNHLQKQFVQNEADLEPEIRRVIFGGSGVNGSKEPSNCCSVISQIRQRSNYSVRKLVAAHFILAGFFRAKLALPYPNICAICGWNARLSCCARAVTT